MHLQSRVLGAQHSLHLRKFSSSFGLPLHIQSVIFSLSMRPLYTHAYIYINTERSINHTKCQ